MAPHNKCPECLTQHGLHRWDVKMSNGELNLEVIVKAPDFASARHEGTKLFMDNFDGLWPKETITSHLHVDIAGT